MVYFNIRDEGGKSGFFLRFWDSYGEGLFELYGFGGFKCVEVIFRFIYDIENLINIVLRREGGRG